MFRYKVALPVGFTGKMPVIDVDDEDDMPLYEQRTVVLGHDYDVESGGCKMHLSAGSQITGMIVGKELLPQTGQAGQSGNPKKKE